MLLLLNLLPLPLPTDQIQTHEYKFGDLFEMLTGIIDSKNSGNAKGVTVLRINSFSEDGFLIDQIKNSSPDGNKDNSADLPDTNKLIRKEDFLIYTRGIPRGFSGIQIKTSSDDRFIATHHFIYLRPRLNLVDLDVEYLHLMLELYVKIHLTELYRKKTENSRAAINSISIKELKQQTITLLTDKETQKMVVSAYNEQLVKLKVAQSELERIGQQILVNSYLSSVN